MENYASIIIDDPILRENYGFLNYRKLLYFMDKHNFHTSIAFIPWNYKRTDKRIAELFLERPDRFSICVHGCNHTESEFGSTDSNYLDHRIKLATARMVEHERRYGLPFDRIMVFPQGVFSNTALEVLKRNYYWAAINTEERPVDGKLSSNFPFFLRVEPDVTKCVLNPSLIVLHHDFFINGYKKLTDFIDKFNKQKQDVKWCSLGNIVRAFVTVDNKDYRPMDKDPDRIELYGFREKAKIAFRRYASEFRDNYLSKNERLLKYAVKIKDLF
jgi:hypothetical protein